MLATYLTQGSVSTASNTSFKAPSAKVDADTTDGVEDVEGGLATSLTVENDCGGRGLVASGIGGLRGSGSAISEGCGTLDRGGADLRAHA